MGNNFSKALSYLGVAATSPPNFTIQTREPAVTDYKKFNLGDLWLEKTTANAWMLTSKAARSATWTSITASGGTTVTSLTVNPGNLTVTAGDVSIAAGSLTIGALTAGTMRTSAAGVVSTLADGADGTVLIGKTGLAPAWATLTAGAGVVITEAVGAITIATVAAASSTFTTSDVAVVIPDGAGNLNVIGYDANITTNGATANTVKVRLSDDIASVGYLSSGTYITAASYINSGTNMNCTTALVVGTALTLTTGNVTIGDFGNGVVLSSGAGVLTSSPGTDIGQILISGGAAFPKWGNITSAGTTITITKTDETINLEASGGTIISINEQVGTTYTLALTDASKLISLSNAAAIVLTIPTNATVPFNIGTEILLSQDGAGQVTVTPAVGVTLNSPGARAKTYEQYSVAALVKKGLDLWQLVGDIA